MSAPRLEIHLDRIHHNANALVERLAARGITVTGVTKATLGSPEVASELIRAGVSAIGDSRIENIEAMRRAGLNGPMVLIRAPMPSQADRVVASAEVSLNSELDTIARLSISAGAEQRRHGVVLMVELGDLREGILPRDLEQVARRTVEFEGIDLVGIGANLACQSGVAPGAANMAELSALASALEARLAVRLPMVSGGNSANLNWALGTNRHVAVATRGAGRVNNLRLGESILLGCEPLQRQPIDGLHTDAITLVAEIIESRIKPSRPWGHLDQTAFGLQADPVDRGDRTRVIVALGRQDVDPDGLVPPDGLQLLGASSDHLVLDGGDAAFDVGAQVRFGLNYSALLRTMTSPFVDRVFVRDTPS